MEQLSNKLGVLRDYVNRVEDKAVKSVKNALRASPLIVAMLSGCALDSASSQPKQQEVSNQATDSESGTVFESNQPNEAVEESASKDEKKIRLALSAGEGETLVSTPVFNSLSILRLVISDKDDADNFTITLGGHDLNNGVDAYLPEALPKNHVAVLRAYVEDSCVNTPESISNLDQIDCGQEVIIMETRDPEKQAEQCKIIESQGNICATGNDEAPVPYAW